MIKIYTIELVEGARSKSLGTVSGFDLVQAYLVQVVKTETTGVWTTPKRLQDFLGE